MDDFNTYAKERITWSYLSWRVPLVIAFMVIVLLGCAALPVGG